MKKQKEIKLPSEYSPFVILMLFAIGLTILLSVILSLYMSNWTLRGDDWKFLLVYTMIGSLELWL